MPASLTALRSSVRRLHDAAFPGWQVHVGDALTTVPTLGEKRFRAIVTSPPYYLKRAYDVPSVTWNTDPDCEHEWQTRVRKGVSGGSGEASAKLKARKDLANFQIVPDQAQNECSLCGGWTGQLGLEPTLDRYIYDLGEVYDACKPTLTDDGTLWIVVDDSYAGSGRGPSGYNAAVPNQTRRQGFDSPGAVVPEGMKAKDLMGVPYEIARELRSRGWYWRADIIWHKPNGMPGSQQDRPTHVYEHVLMFSKSRTYFANPIGLSEPTTRRDDLRVIRDVWSINPEPTGHGHYAAYPRALATRCIAIGSRAGDEVLDPMAGICRTGLAALSMRRSFTGVDLGQQYLAWGAAALESLRVRLEKGIA